MKNINFLKTRFSCYALGRITGLDTDEKLSAAEKKLLQKLETKEEKTEEEAEAYRLLKNQSGVAEKTLSKTCISYLREELFIYLKYGERIRPGAAPVGESVTRIVKGTLCENMAIELLSKHDGINYRKNIKKYKNKWVKGIPDINYKKRLGDRKIIDIKCSWDMYTFMANIPKKLSDANNCQVQGYLNLTKADVGEVCHVLVSAPDELIEKQVNKLKFKEVFASQQEFDEAAAMIRKSMRFDDIPEERRIIRFPVIPDEKLQSHLFERVDLCRQWLMEYQAKHEGLFKK